MKHSFKSWIALLLCLLLIVPMVMTACKKKSDDPKDSTPESSEDTTSDTQGTDNTDDTDDTDDTSNTDNTDDTSNTDDTQDTSDNNNNNSVVDDDDEDEEEEEEGPAVEADVLASSVALSSYALTMVKGSTSSLVAIVSPSETTDKTVTWTSSDATVVKVENGTLTALKAGKATITVSTANGKTAICTVTVTEAATAITLDKTSLWLYRGDTATLTASAPNVTWNSSNPEIATVDKDGKIVATGFGTAVIMATDSTGTKSATCTVRIVVNYQITLDLAGGSLPAEVENTLAVTYNESYTLPTPNKSGYNFTGWVYNETPVELEGAWTASDKDATLTATFALASYELSVAPNIENIATVVGAGTYKYTSTVPLTAGDSTLLGYTFDGWYNGSQKLSSEKEFNYTMDYVNTELIAKYVPVAELAPFEFEATVESVRITGVTDATVTAVTIPAYVTEINTEALIALTSLREITVDEGNTVYESAGNCLIESATDKLLVGLASSEIPEDGSVTTIAANAFKNRKALINITIPASITLIEDDAFAGCTSLLEIYNKSISIIIDLEATDKATANGGIAANAKNVYTTEDGSKIVVHEGTKLAFFNDTELQLVGYIGEATELELPAMIDIGSGEKSYTIALGALGGTNLTKLTIPALSDNFYELFGSEIAAIPSTLTELVIKGGTIAGNAFQNVTTLQKVTIEKDVTLSKNAFKNCKGLTEVSINTNLSLNVFDGCTALTTVTIGSEVTKIERDAFKSTALTSVTMASYTWQERNAETPTTFTGPEDAATQLKNSGTQWTRSES